MIPDKPSPLALKLAARLFRKTAAKRAFDIEHVLSNHRYEEWQRVRDENKLKASFCDNVCVFAGRDRREFFELQLLPAEPDLLYEVMLKRYCVPGRCWTYGFQWVNDGSGRVVYGSEGTAPLAQSLKLIVADLDKPQVVDLFKQAFGAERIVCRYQQDTLQLLRALAPRCKVLRAIEPLIEQTRVARQARFEAQRAAEKATLT